MLAEREENRKKYNVSCDYTERAGTISIVRIDTLENQEIRVFYSFKPDVASEIDEEYKLADKERILVINSTYPSRKWCQMNGIKLGEKYPAYRMELVEGYKPEYCDQVDYKFPSLEK